MQLIGHKNKMYSLKRICTTRFINPTKAQNAVISSRITTYTGANKSLIPWTYPIYNNCFFRALLVYIKLKK
jgi:hypothetical protein